MTREEFEKRTGIYVPENFYAVIEKAYLDFKGDKDAFCVAYKNNADGLASGIQRRAELLEVEMQSASDKRAEDYKAQIAEMKKSIEELEKSLEQEMEWQPYEDKNNVSQSDYEDMAERPYMEHLSDLQAKGILSEQFGFLKGRITIVHEIQRYEVNRHHVLRVVGEYRREPLYVASDWNYIRFNCGSVSYELFNGELRFFYE